MTLKRVEKGIYVRDGGVYYVLYTSESGRTVWYSTRQKSLKLARMIYEKRRTEVAERINLPNRRFLTVKFAELAEHWWQREGSKKASQWQYLIPRVRDRFGKARARQVTSDAVQDFLDEIRTTLSASSTNHHRTILSRIFNFAIERREYDQNPVTAVAQYREPPGRDRFPTVDEVRAVLERLADDVEVVAAIMVLATTTLRKSEILRRRLSELRLDEKVPYVYIPETKNHDPKKVPLPAIAVSYLLKLPAWASGGEWAFPSHPTTKHPKPKRPYRWDIGKEFRQACRAAGISNLRVHDLRHMGISILTEQGLAPEIIRKISGHRGRQLDRYQHLSEALKRQTVDIIAEVLFADKKETPDGETVH